MMGTLAKFLAEASVETTPDKYWTEVTGDIENVDGVLKITRIAVDFHLRASEEQAPKAREAMDVYIEKCPAAQSVIGCIDIRDSLIIEPVD